MPGGWNFMSISVCVESLTEASAIIGGDEMYRLGIAAAVGEEGGIDLVTAHKWFNLAAMLGNAEARRHRAELALEMTQEEIAHAQRLAREYLKTTVRAA
jgi:TPR repeat protein